MIFISGTVGSQARLIVAHRPEAIAWAQRVVGLQWGKVLAVEQDGKGAPDELQIQ